MYLTSPTQLTELAHIAEATTGNTYLFLLPQLHNCYTPNDLYCIL